MISAFEFQKLVAGDTFGSVRNYCIDGICSRCGDCCSDILPVTDEELNKLRKFVRSRKYKPNTQVKIGMMVRYDMTCPFLNSESRHCDVYDIRPEVCRLLSAMLIQMKLLCIQPRSIWILQ